MILEWAGGLVGGSAILFCVPFFFSQPAVIGDFRGCGNKVLATRGEAETMRQWQANEFPGRLNENLPARVQTTVSSPSDNDVLCNGFRHLAVSARISCSTEGLVRGSKVGKRCVPEDFLQGCRSRVSKLD